MAAATDSSGAPEADRAAAEAAYRVALGLRRQERVVGVDGHTGEVRASPANGAGHPREGVLSRHGAVRAPLSERYPMSDKSPRQRMSQKSSKSIKEKRADKRAKSEHASEMETVLHPKKR